MSLLNPLLILLILLQGNVNLNLGTEYLFFYNVSVEYETDHFEYKLGVESKIVNFKKIKNGKGELYISAGFGLWTWLMELISDNLLFSGTLSPEYDWEMRGDSFIPISLAAGYKTKISKGWEFKIGVCTLIKMENPCREPGRCYYGEEEYHYHIIGKEFFAYPFLDIGFNFEIPLMSPR
jgi:hypothetical protein